jgi:hypothetical protein
VSVRTSAETVWDQGASSASYQNSPCPDNAGIHQMQRIVGSILYYARAVNMTILMALGTIASKQTKATEKTLEKCTQLLN